MKKSLIYILTFLNFISYGQSYLLWPVANKKAGENILHKPNDFVGNELNQANVFIETKENTVIVSPCNGTIQSVNRIIYSSLNSISGIPIEVKNEKDIETLLKNYKTCFKPSLKNIKYITTSLSIVNSNNELFNIWGITDLKKFKTGQKIRIGDTIGFAKYSYRRIKKSSIGFSKSINGKPADPMSVFGLKSSFLQKKLLHYQVNL